MTDRKKLRAEISERHSATLEFLAESERDEDQYHFARIDWHLISRAVEVYQRIGYQYVEVPYFVPLDILRLTLPPQYDPDRVPMLGCLVGSAEQSLLSMDLPDGRYVAVSPCFRPEPVLDELHQRHFMKVELFALGERQMDPQRMLYHARQFKAAYAKTETVTTPEGWDLTVDGIEVGSYGFREAGGRRWACGTGLALPRFDIARAKQARRLLDGPLDGVSIG